MAHHGQIPVGQLVVPLVRERIMGCAVIDRRTVQVADALAEADEYPESRSRALQSGWRTALGVPLVRAGEAIGVIFIRRIEVRPFTERQIELVNTFADQAVIAIENTRLFEEVQARTRDLTESLEQQTATSEVLSVISSSPTDVQPVLDAIVKTAVKLCSSHDAVILLKDVNDLHIVAHHGPVAVDFARIPIARDTVAGRSIVDRAPVHIHDLADETQSVEFPLGQHIAVRLNQRTVLGLPLLREGHAIGCLFLRRTELLPFTEKQIALLQTFADQAVIAIENTRLFEAEQASKRELQESLEYQTATTEVLDVISRSPTNSQPVLDTIAVSIRRLSGSTHGSVFLFHGGQIHLASHAGLGPAAAQVLAQSFPQVPGCGGATARALLSRQVAYIPYIPHSRRALLCALRQSGWPTCLDRKRRSVLRASEVFATEPVLGGQQIA